MKEMTLLINQLINKLKKIVMNIKTNLIMLKIIHLKNILTKINLIPNNYFHLLNNKIKQIKIFLNQKHVHLLNQVIFLIQ